MSNDKEIPASWRIASDYDPNEHMMSLKGKAYLDVANRLLWFVRDQRDFIVRGCATCSYIVRTELVEQDRQAGFAQFKTYVRDVLGNEATMYGSETAKDFGDYAEKASTKSLGRALAMLGYGTAAAPEMDEGDRIVDSPVERKSPSGPYPKHPEVAYTLSDARAMQQQSAFAARPPVLHAPVNTSADAPAVVLPAVPGVWPAVSAPAAPKSGAASDEQRERMRQQRNILHILDKTVERADNILNARQADERIKAYDQRIADRQQKAEATR